jgi:hypothetical protein
MAPSPLATSLKLFEIRFIEVNPENGHGAHTLRIVTMVRAGGDDTRDGISRSAHQNQTPAFRLS